MAPVTDRKTGFLLGDPDADIFPNGYSLDFPARHEALKHLILSASGWRKVFAPGFDEESTDPLPDPCDREILLAMGEAFSDFLFSRTGKQRPCIAVGIDTRHTGPVMAEILLRVFLSRGISVRYLFITAAPEIMAFVHQKPEADGFAYVSASHNPIGHNGLKFGLRGGVLGGKDSAELITAFKTIAGDESRMSEVLARLRGLDSEKIRTVFMESESWKNEALEAYTGFAKEVAANSPRETDQRIIFDDLKRSIAERGCGIVAELNGSARTLSIDAGLLEELGIKVRLVNGRPRMIAHRIVPEGASLDECRRELEEARRQDPSFLFGYVPDNDGDRGNIVYYDEEADTARVMEAQEVFALACVSELSCSAAELSRSREKPPRMQAVVVNGPTSLRIEKIANFFGAEVHRAEVGEANVVALAAKLRREGYEVRILGEGSNGGNITHPSEVRDPLSTVFSLLKLLFLSAGHPEKSPQAEWFRRSGQALPPASARPSIRRLWKSLPEFISLSAFEPEALMKIQTRDQKEFKARYEKVFLREWDRRLPVLSEKFGIYMWEEINYEGMEARSGMGSAYRSGSESGGLKILLKDSKEDSRAFLWMRGSGTEPVFRLLVDVEGNRPDMLNYLLEWQRSMISEADSE